MPLGVPASRNEVEGRSAEALRSLGDANMAARGLSFGSVVKDRLVGKFDAVWAQITLPAGTAEGEKEVPHTLGRIPSLAACVQQEGNGYAGVYLTNRAAWSASSIRVYVTTALTGSLNNLTLTFLVGG